MPMNIKKMLASTLAVITMASGATALTSHAEDFTEVAEVEEMTLSALVAEQLEEKEIAGEISAEDVATTIRVAEQVEEMRNQDMISDEDVLEWEQVLVGNYDMNAVATYSNYNDYVPYDYYNSERYSNTQHYLAIINGAKIYGGTGFQVVFYLNRKPSSDSIIKFYDYAVKENYKNFCSPNLYTEMNDNSPSININSLCTITRDWSCSNSIPAFSTCERLKLVRPLGFASEQALHCATSKYSYSPSINIENTAGYECQLKKCLYSIGDVDRNGFVEPADSLAIGICAQGGYDGNSKTPKNASSYNELAFNLAADVNDDNVIDMADVELVNKHILGQILL